MSFEISKLKRTILGISIAIILVLFIGYGINTFYKPPKYEDFCEEGITRKIISTEEECLAVGGQWNVQPETPVGENEPIIKGFCNPDYTCNKEFRSENEIYNRNVFIVAVILGLISVILGGIILKLESVSSGIMGGGVLTIIYGTVRYWGDLADVGRFIILGIVLGVLIWIGYKKFRK
jgi:uncharacterized membrane protein YkgB